ncbi:MAG: THUMP domain-containing protein [Promethearchaeota archaeon]
MVQKKCFVNYYNLENSKSFVEDFSRFFDLFEFTNILIRYSEIGTKSLQVQQRMEKSFLDAIKIQLKKFRIKYTKYYYERGRIIFSFRKEDATIGSFILLHIPGVASISPIFKTDPKLNTIIKKFYSYISKILKPKQSIGVHVKIKKKDFTHTPQEVALKCVENALAGFKHKERGNFDLRNPDIKIFIEIREKMAYLYSLKIEGVFSGLPIEKQRISPAIYLYRIHDFYAMLKMLQRGQHILPIIFKIGNPDFYASFEQFWEFFNLVYPVEGFYGIKINIKPFLDHYRELFGDSICYFCRYIRFKSIVLMKQFQRKYIIKLLKKSKLKIDSISNILYKIPKNNIKTRFLRGIIDGEGNGIYCPYTPIIWKQNLMFEEILIQPNIGRDEDEILNLIKKLAESNIILERLKSKHNFQKSNEIIKNLSKKIVRFQKILDLVENKRILNAKICDFRPNNFDEIFKDKDSLQKFIFKLEKIKNLDDKLINLLYNGRLVRLF